MRTLCFVTLLILLFIPFSVHGKTTTREEMIEIHVNGHHENWIMQRTEHGIRLLNPAVGKKRKTVPSRQFSSADEAKFTHSARKFLLENYEIFKIASRDYLKLSQCHPFGWAIRLDFYQVVDGYKVEGSDIFVTFLSDGSVCASGSNYFPHLVSDTTISYSAEDVSDKLLSKRSLSRVNLEETRPVVKVKGATGYLCWKLSAKKKDGYPYFYYVHCATGKIIDVVPAYIKSLSGVQNREKSQDTKTKQSKPLSDFKLTDLTLVADGGPRKRRSKPDPSVTWHEIIFENFDKPFPTPGWKVYVETGAFDDHYWGVQSEIVKTGTGALWSCRWPAGLRPWQDKYPPNMNAWAVYGPMNLSQATQFRIQFDDLIVSENLVDGMTIGFSLDGVNFQSWALFHGASRELRKEWIYRDYPVGTVGTILTLGGEPRVWIALVFQSDHSVGFWGAFIDNFTFLANAAEPRENEVKTYWTRPTSPTNYNFSTRPAALERNKMVLRDATGATLEETTTDKYGSWRFTQTGDEVRHLFQNDVAAIRDVGLHGANAGVLANRRAYASSLRFIYGEPGARDDHGFSAANTLYHMTELNFLFKSLNVPHFYKSLDTYINSNGTYFTSASDGEIHLQVGIPPNFRFKYFVEAVCHEYTHSIQHTNNLKLGEVIATKYPFRAKSVSGEPRAIGEAMADYYASTHLDHHEMISVGRNHDNKNRYDRWAVRNGVKGPSGKGVMLILDEGVKLEATVNDLGWEHHNCIVMAGAFWEIRKRIGQVLADQLIWDTISSSKPNTFIGVCASAKSIAQGSVQRKNVRFAFAMHGIYNDEDSIEGNIYKDNDEFSRATVITPGIYNNLRCYDDDWYKVRLLKKTDISISFDNSWGNLQLALYDSKKKRLAKSMKNKNTEKISFSPKKAGNYYVHVFGKKGAINDYVMKIASGPINDKIKPVGAIKINNNDKKTQTLDVTIKINATDKGGSGLAQMRFSGNSKSWSAWENFAGTKDWNLSSYGGNTRYGKKTVYAQIRDGSGNTSTVIKDSIQYVKPTKPELSVMPDAIKFGTLGTKFEIIVSNVGKTTLNYEITKNVAWITSISPAKGSVKGGKSKTVKLSATRSGLQKSKTYSGVVTITSNGGNKQLYTSINENSPTICESVKPGKGNGPAETFVASYREHDGAADFKHLYFKIHENTQGSNAAYLIFDLPKKQLMLRSDDNTYWIEGKLGSNATLSNSQVVVYLLLSRSKLSGNKLELSLRLVFKKGFTGQKNIYMSAIDQFGNVTPWQTMGTYRVTSGVPHREGIP